MDGMSIGRSAARDFGDETFGEALAPDRSAVGSLLDEHRDLVLGLALRNAHRTSDPAVVIEAGIEGLLDAAMRFDSSCGEFRPFASWWIRRAIDRRLAA